MGPNSLTDVTVTIVEGATVDAPNFKTAVALGSDAHVINEGFLSGQVGVSVSTGGLVENLAEGVIEGVTQGVVATGDTVIENKGGISARSAGVEISGGATLINSGTITSTFFNGFGVLAQDATVVNTGTIEGGYRGSGSLTNDGLMHVLEPDNELPSGAYGSGTFVNNDTFVVEGSAGAWGITWDGSMINNGDIRIDSEVASVGFFMSGKLENSGVIEVTSAELAIGVRLDLSSEIDNSGTITAVGPVSSTGILLDTELAGRVATVSNSGTITATTAIDGRNGLGGSIPTQLDLTNSGAINGDIVLHDGTDRIRNQTGGQINGDIGMGGGDDMLTVESGSAIKGDIDGGAGIDAIASTGGVLDGKVIGFETLSVTGGLLEADLGAGSAIGQTTVASGAAALLGGSVVGDVSNAGTLGPGNGIGTLDVTGNYTQAPTGEYLAELGAGAADKLAVSGTAALGGALTTGLVAQDPGTLEGKSYTVLTAGSISGGFDTAGTVEQGFWTLDVQQTGTAVTVTVTDVDVPIGATVPVTAALAGGIAAAAPGASQGAASLSYDSLGDWESAAPAFVAGWNEMGPRTPTGAMPRTGSAAFEGTTRGELTETGSPEAFVVEGNVLLTANFASGLVNADFTGMEKIDSRGVSAAWTDFRARMSIADGTSEFAGTAGSDDGVWNGRARGGFYGDENGMPGHAAGMWSLSSSLGQAVGGFMARRR